MKILPLVMAFRFSFTVFLGADGFTFNVVDVADTPPTFITDPRFCLRQRGFAVTVGVEAGPVA